MKAAFYPFVLLPLPSRSRQRDFHSFQVTIKIGLHKKLSIEVTKQLN